MAYKIEIERETDGRWIAEIPNLPGAVAYGRTRKEAVAAVEALALRELSLVAAKGSMASEETRKDISDRLLRRAEKAVEL